MALALKNILANDLFKMNILFKSYEYWDIKYYKMGTCRSKNLILLKNDLNLKSSSITLEGYEVKVEDKISDGGSA